METEKKRFKKLFPHLSQEMEEGESQISVGGYREDSAEAERETARRYSGYEPTVVDFIRGCDRQEQAVEIIDFMEKREEISKDYAESLRQKIRKEGLRSLGQKKRPGFYEEASIRQ